MAWRILKFPIRNSKIVSKDSITFLSLSFNMSHERSVVLGFKNFEKILFILLSKVVWQTANLQM